jgi:hypothetical protein
MQQALDALEVMRPACFAKNTLKAADTAITALRDRLAQPEQTLTCVCGAVWEGELMVHAPRDRLAQPERPWVGLTDEEIKGLATDDVAIPMTGRMWIFVDDIEAKLKEKNT